MKRSSVGTEFDVEFNSGSRNYCMVCEKKNRKCC